MYVWNVQQSNMACRDTFPTVRPFATCHSRVSILTSVSLIRTLLQCDPLSLKAQPESSGVVALYQVHSRNCREQVARFFSPAFREVCISKSDQGFTSSSHVIGSVLGAFTVILLYLHNNKVFKYILGLQRLHTKGYWKKPCGWATKKNSLPNPYSPLDLWQFLEGQLYKCPAISSQSFLSFLPLSNSLCVKFQRGQGLQCSQYFINKGIVKEYQQ